MRNCASARACADASRRVPSEISRLLIANRTGRPGHARSSRFFVSCASRRDISRDATRSSCLPRRSANTSSFQPSNSASTLSRRKRAPGTARPTPNPVVNFVSRLQISSFENIRVSGNEISGDRDLVAIFSRDVTGTSVRRRTTPRAVAFT